jgi:CubicO group peptidase (beta-lactamase class C family)
MTIHETAADRRQFLAALVAAAAVPSIARAKAPGGAHASVRAMIDRHVAEKKVANMVVAIGGRQGPPDFVSAGALELGAGPAAGPDSLYRIYSMSKCITGCAIMILVEQGKLTLDTPLASIFPAYAQMNVLTDPANSLETRPATKPILIRHIVTHTSGLVYNSTGPAPLANLYTEKGIIPGRATPDVEARWPANLIAFAEAAAAMRSVWMSPAPWSRRFRARRSTRSSPIISSRRWAWATRRSPCPPPSWFGLPETISSFRRTRRSNWSRPG